MALGGETVFGPAAAWLRLCSAQLETFTLLSPVLVAVVAMAAQLFAEEMSEEQMAGHLSKTSSDLLHIWDDAKVARAVQAKFSELGFTDTECFANMALSADDVRELVLTEIGLKPNLGILGRNVVSRVLGAWKTANTRGEKQRTEDAQRAALGLPRALSDDIHIEMRNAYEDVHGKIMDSKVPAAPFLDSLDAMIQKNKYEAERLKFVVSKEEALGEAWSELRVGPSGALLAQRSSRAETKPPATTEEYRKRIFMIGAGWEMMRLRYPTRPQLAGLLMSDWSDHAEWILGDRVFGATIATTSAGAKYSPSWQVVLELCYQVRKRAMEAVVKG